jgi:hypothetical protein
VASEAAAVEHLVLANLFSLSNSAGQHKKATALVGACAAAVMAFWLPNWGVFGAVDVCMLHC